MVRFLIAILFVGACTTNQNDFNQDKIVTPSQNKLKASKDLVEAQGVNVYDESSLSWRSCVLGSGPSVLVLLDNKQFKNAHCDSPLVQAFAAAGFEVMEINEPNHGSSEDLGIGSDQDLETVQAFLDDVKLAPAGLWAEGLNSILGARVAKHVELQWAIFAEGVFDLEIALQDPSPDGTKLKKLVDQGESRDMEIEKRSVAWDYDGFPSYVYLYNQSQSQSRAKMQSESFAKVLSAAQIRVQVKTFQGKLNDQGHNQMVTDALRFFPKSP